MKAVLCHFGETVVDETTHAEVRCDAVASPLWVAAVTDAGGVSAFGRCCRCGEIADPEASAIRAHLAEAFESALRKG